MWWPRKLPFVIQYATCPERLSPTALIGAWGTGPPDGPVLVSLSSTELPCPIRLSDNLEVTLQGCPQADEFTSHTSVPLLLRT
jgi:hypothetical protein